MANRMNLDDEDDFGGDYAEKRAGSKRSFGELEDDEDDLFGSKKGNSKVEETAPGVATGMILSLRESLQNCKDTLATCQLKYAGRRLQVAIQHFCEGDLRELEVARLEIQKWHSAFQNEPYVPVGTSPDTGLVVNYLQTLKSSEDSLREQLEKAKKKEAAFIVTFAKRELEIAELKSAVRDLKLQLKPASVKARRLLLDPAIHEEFSRLKNLVEEKEKKVKELQDNVAAVNFTTQSRMGKSLMDKCRTLQKENEEKGTLASEGKIHELAMELASKKSQNADLRSQCEGICKCMEELTNDVEKSNEMVLVLQESLEEKDSELKRLKDALNQKKEVNKGEIIDGNKETAEVE